MYIFVYIVLLYSRIQPVVSVKPMTTMMCIFMNNSLADPGIVTNDEDDNNDNNNDVL